MQTSNMSRITALSLLLWACNTEPGAGSNGEASATQTSAGSDDSGAVLTVTSTGEAPTTAGDSSTGDSSTGAVVSTGDSSTGAVASTGEDTGSSTGEDTGSSGEDTGSSTSSTGESSSGGDEGLGEAAQSVVDELELAVEGVLYLSESDYPWTVVAFADAAPVTEQDLKALIADVYVPHEGQATLEERVIEVRTLAQLMDPLTTPQDWWGDYEVMQAEQYTQIRAIFEGQLVNVQVFRLGELFGNDLMGAIDVYVLGETADGDVVGMWSVAVET